LHAQVFEGGLIRSLANQTEVFCLEIVHATALAFIAASLPNGRSDGKPRGSRPEHALSPCGAHQTKKARTIARPGL
ncbi:MAG: hypothetical protein ABR504_05025, partial [Paracoccaceae bacterium]